MRIRHRQFGGLFALVFILAACGTQSASSDAPGTESSAPSASDGGGTDGGEALTIDIGTPSDTLSSSFYAFVVARDLGYWEEENLTVNLVPGSGSGSLVEQIVAGNLPTGAPSTPAVVEALGSGLELVNWYHYQTGSIFGIWVPEDSDIQSVEDLAGKTIGISEPGGGELAVLNAALEDAGIDPVTGVSTIPVGTGEPVTVEALESGQVDAYSSSKNDSFSLISQGVALRDITPPLYEDFPGRAMITTQESLDEHREEFIRFARGIAKATLFCDTNPDACEQLMRDAQPEQWLAEGASGTSQGELQLAEAYRTTRVASEGELFGAHNADAWQNLQDTIAATLEDFEAWDVEAFLDDDLHEEINDFDREAVIEQAENYEG